MTSTPSTQPTAAGTPLDFIPRADDPFAWHPPEWMIQDTQKRHGLDRMQAIYRLRGERIMRERTKPGYRLDVAPHFRAED